jgi:hypothetical protein
MTESEKLIEIARARMKAAPLKLIEPTLRYLSLLVQERDYSIESIFPSINGVVAKVTKECSGHGAMIV